MTTIPRLTDSTYPRPMIHQVPEASQSACLTTPNTMSLPWRPNETGPPPMRSIRMEGQAQPGKGHETYQPDKLYPESVSAQGPINDSPVFPL
jgi:hypothetical protein